MDNERLIEALGQVSSALATAGSLLARLLNSTELNLDEMETFTIKTVDDVLVFMDVLLAAQNNLRLILSELRKR